MWRFRCQAGRNGGTKPRIIPLLTPIRFAYACWVAFERTPTRRVCHFKNHRSVCVRRSLQREKRVTVVIYVRTPLSPAAGNVQHWKRKRCRGGNRGRAVFCNYAAATDPSRCGGLCVESHVGCKKGKMLMYSLPNQGLLDDILLREAGSC